VARAASPDNVWWLTVVYGPQADQDKIQFLEELLSTSGAWMLCGDFNMIYLAADKNNDRLDRRAMRRFRNFLGAAQLEEVHLQGRRFTWSSERDRPTLERLERVFVTADWLHLYPNHLLRALSSDCSDHAPLLLSPDVVPWAKKRFRFESFWTKMPGFVDVVAAAWSASATLIHADACRVLDYKLRNVARALRSWSDKKLGSVRLQLALAREVILRYDEAQEHRVLTQQEAQLRRRLQVRVLGLASLLRTMARQRSRMLFLSEGDANTKFFHLMACHRKRRSYIRSLKVDGTEVVTDEAKAEALYQHYLQLLGTNFARSRRFDLNIIGVPSADLSGLETLFSEEEVWAVIKELPNDKALGPDGFTGLFYKTAWPIIKADVMNAFNAFWAADSRSFNLLNDAYMVLLKKKEQPEEIRDYRPISLIHSFGKLVTKCLARRLGVGAGWFNHAKSDSLHPGKMLT
jgi:hypothetical protein